MELARELVMPVPDGAEVTASCASRHQGRGLASACCAYWPGARRLFHVEPGDTSWAAASRGTQSTHGNG